MLNLSLFNLFFILLFFINSNLFSQNLPNEYYFSLNNNQLLRGLNIIDSGLYNESEIDTIFLYFDQNNYWDQLHSNYCDKINIPATLVYKDEVFLEVGVRFKGQTSFFNTNGNNGGGPGGGGPGGGGPGGGGPGASVDTDKKSFNIELDWLNNQNIEGYETLNLNNCYQDPSFLREFIYEKLSRKYIPASKVNFIQLMINDQNWGIYPNVQQLDKKHAGEWFFDNNCTRWRAESPSSEAPGCGEPNGVNGGGPGGGPDFGAGTSSLNYLGSDTSIYMSHYTLKKSYKDNPWVDIVNACEVLNEVDEISTENVYSFLNQYLDLDATLWFLADEIIFSDDDSYINKGGMDYYLYFDIYNNRLLPIEYDGNTVFGSPNWSPFYNVDNSDFALLNKLLLIPELRERYLAHFRVILNNSFNSEYINELIDEYSSFIDLHVYNDPQKIYSYNEFINSINDLKDFFNNRSSYLWSNNEVSQLGANIINVEYYVGSSAFAQPSSSDEVLVSVEVDTDFPIEVNLYYGNDLTGNFEKFSMEYSFATNLYTYSIPQHDSGEYVRFYIETVNNNGSRVYSPEGAEHDVYIYQVKIDNLNYVDSDIVINEIMASNDNIATDSFGEYDDWIELYNKGYQSINLEGFHLSDDVALLDKYTFPNVVLNPGDYFIVWADDDEEDQGDYNHATFKLSASGEQLYLSDNNLNILDEVVFGLQITDMGLARVPNGTGDFIIQNPTFNYNNDQNSFQFENNISSVELIKVVNILGQEVELSNEVDVLFYIYSDGSVSKKMLIN
ncbi:MAG: hypothetical protein CMP49_03145 [Flavobacteriales bacterium]|nr:hypothetical protein [Flavobacteriales bacterium]|tara:strand:- start:5115 stop:7463 length:2349 start_codon:yes stop_codon:yes gene_type:complete